MGPSRLAPAVVFAPGAPPARRVAAWGAEAVALGSGAVARGTGDRKEATRRARGTRWRLWRRLCAVVLAVASLFAAVEPAFAEAHDGDGVATAAAAAPNAAVPAWTEASDASPGAPAVIGHAGGAGHFAPGPVVAAASPDEPAPDAPGLPMHGVHVCHCAHAHGAALPPVHVIVAEATVPAHRAPRVAVRTAVQPAAAAPPVPPPIA